jgi:hypothetical protein
MLGVHPTILTEITRQVALERERVAAVSRSRRRPRLRRRRPVAPAPARRPRFARDGG